VNWPRWPFWRVSSVDGGCFGAVFKEKETMFRFFCSHLCTTHLNADVFA
jgi:hypothetical protein